MDKIRITGGKPLQGTISIQGSKNSALPMMAASLLHRGVSVLKGCPAIAGGHSQIPGCSYLVGKKYPLS